MTQSVPAAQPLAAECRVFCRYLADLEPSAYVLACYQRAGPTVPAGSSRFLIDRALLSVARWGSLATRIADGYARMFRPYAPLRQRLVLLLAILENSPPSDVPLNSAVEGSRPAIMAGMALTLLTGGVCLLAGILLLGPLHLVSVLGGKR
jgi:hypothetical protein